MNEEGKIVETRRRSRGAGAGGHGGTRALSLDQNPDVRYKATTMVPSSHFVGNFFSH